MNYVKTAESVYSCDQCHASPISDNRKCDNSEGACHTGNTKPPDHTADYLKAHKVLSASTQVSNSKPYYLACHGFITDTGKNCGFHTVSAASAAVFENYHMKIPVNE